jgi:hypothetical protein
MPFAAPVPGASPAGEARLPIFDSVESDWFRRSGTTGTAPRQTQDGQPGWTSPADEGWRAAQVITAPRTRETTSSGLPRRVPQANLVPGSVGGGVPAGHEAAAEGPARSADVARSRMASFQRGVQEGRAATPESEERRSR